MDQTTCFNPPLVCQLLDGSRVRFARVTMGQWATMAEEMRSERVASLLAEIDKAEGLKPKERLDARIAANDHTVSISTAIDRCLNEPKWIERLLLQQAQGAREDAEKALSLIPAIQQASIAHQIAMLPVVKGPKAGTDENPLMPGVDLSGGDGQAASGDSTDATQSASPIDNSTNMPG